MNTRLSYLFQAIENSTVNNKDELKKETLFCLNCFINYFNTVVSENLYYSTTPAHLQNTYMMKARDEQRREAHDVCVSACFRINEICSVVHVAPFCNFNTEDRHQVAEFCGYLISTLYFGNIQYEKTFDELVEKFSVTGEWARQIEERDVMGL